jgi:phage-related protein
MPRARVILYREVDGTVPLLDWLARLPPKAKAKCLERLQRLRELGHELRRPHADYLRDEIYELRAKWGTVNYRMLYFFHGSVAAVVSHGIVKEGRVPPKAIDWARERKRKFETDPGRHTFEEEV